MADDLDPAAVERLSAAWFARAQSWGAMAGDGSAMGAVEREKAAVRRDMAMTFVADLSALTAAGAGEPAAPTVSAEQVREVIDGYVQDDHDDIAPEDGWRLVRDLRALLAEPTP